ncbi:MAG: 30S ribosomal protein S18 [Candidatus Omnitrophica bacterium]|nr:30S ribosomal protein S18 [Candidatus Omnitrophota bacterium]MDD5436970.1 30S ribosomal protein S18 [Candidatus Omnitrophota bacterium]
MSKPFGKLDRKKVKRDPLKKKKVFKKRPCRFCNDKVENLDFIEYLRFQKFLTERGKIVPSRISGNCAKHQRQLSKAIHKARIMALLPFVSE